MEAVMAMNRVFDVLPEKKSMCAHYVYLMAKTYATEKEVSPNDGGHGNCGSRMYYDSLKALGYREVKNVDITKEELVGDIRNSRFPDGAVIAYKAISKPQDPQNVPNAYKYGHTQFHIGGGKWSTSVKNNYGSDFVYNKIPSRMWNYRVFLPPKK